MTAKRKVESPPGARPHSLQELMASRSFEKFAVQLLSKVGKYRSIRIRIAWPGGNQVALAVDRQRVY